jgi:hypothetical protein
MLSVRVGIATSQKFYPVTYHEGTEGEQKYKYKITLTSALD